LSGVVFPVYLRGNDNDDVTEFPTLAAMQHHLEAIDVENEEYEAWDAQGRRLQLAVGEPKSEWLKIVATQDQLSDRRFAELRSKSQPLKPYVPIGHRFMRWLGSVGKG